MTTPDSHPSGYSSGNPSGARRPPEPALRDAAARERIRTDHKTTLIVEAAAGTGKTTSVVHRVVEFIAAGTAKIAEIAAITFTEKAAGELRLRIRQGIETEIRQERRAAEGRDPAGDAEGDETTGDSRLARLEAALSQLEEASIGTIHAFCGTILRERPIEAGVDPDFETLTEAQQRAFYGEVFQRFLEEQLDDPGPGVARLLRRSRGQQSPIEALREAGRRLLDFRRFEAPWTRREWNADAAVRSLVEENLESLPEPSANSDPPANPVSLATPQSRRAPAGGARSRGREAEGPAFVAPDRGALSAAPQGRPGGEDRTT